jgi:hypothetical protein
MATTQYLSNPALKINGVDLTDQCTNAVVNYTKEQLENTTFGDSARKFTAGLQNNTITVTLYQSYAAGETEASIYSLVGTNVDVIVATTTAALTTPTATAPKYELVQAYLASHTPINASLGELSTIDLVFAGGSLTKSVA